MINKKKVVLVVDDDEAIADSVQLILELNDYTVFISSGEDVMEKIAQHKPVLILLDKWMSGIDGSDICKEIKNNQELQHIPVIMISASKDINFTSRNVGADDYLEKPFEMSELLDKVKKNIPS